MYEAFYKLSSKPFSIMPDPDFLFWGRKHSMAFAMLEYGAANHVGFTVITGDVGCGKTTLIHHLLNRISGDTTIGLVSNTRANSGELLNWVLLAFDQPLSDLSYPMLYQQFRNFVNDEFAHGRRVALIIDEAQNLGLETLEELRLLFNLNTQKEQLLQIILVGQPQLKQQLLRPELTQFAQRVSSDFHLGPLPHDEVAPYINQRLCVAGSKLFLFSEEACDRIATASKGIPRVINILCDTSLIYAFSTGAPLVTEEIINKVIFDKAEYSIFSIDSPEKSRDRLHPV